MTQAAKMRCLSRQSGCSCFLHDIVLNDILQDLADTGGCEERHLVRLPINTARNEIQGLETTWPQDYCRGHQWRRSDRRCAQVDDRLGDTHDRLTRHQEQSVVEQVSLNFLWALYKPCGK